MGCLKKGIGLWGKRYEWQSHERAEGMEFSEGRVG